VGPRAGLYLVARRKILTTPTKRTPWPESASELNRPSDRRLLVKLVPNFADKGCHMVSVTDPYGPILGFLDRKPYFSFQVAPESYSRG
jgi:CBS-domain-containing membrane protein